MRKIEKGCYVRVPAPIKAYLAKKVLRLVRPQCLVILRTLLAEEQRRMEECEPEWRDDPKYWRDWRGYCAGIVKSIRELEKAV